MSVPPYRRSVRPLYPEIPEEICDCALIPMDYCSGVEELVHTTRIAEFPVELDLDGGRTRKSFVVTYWHCPTCGQWWWSDRSSRTDYTYARDTEDMPDRVPIGSTHVILSQAVRCADQTAAEQLTAWWPRYLEAIAVRDRLSRGSGNALPAVRHCIELGEIDAATRMLSETAVRSYKVADETRRNWHGKLTEYRQRLELDPSDAEAWRKLQGAQTMCVGARLADPALQAEDFTEEEWWTPALAGVRRLEYELHVPRNAARGKALQSPEHLALRAAEDQLAQRWEAFLQQMQWPSPMLEFQVLLQHAQDLQPLVVARDMASWNHPDRICRRMRALLDSGAVTVSRHVAVADWIAVRTGLPAARERGEQRNANNYWLSVRRSRRRQ